MTTAENLTPGDTFLYRDETFTVSFTQLYSQSGVMMVRVYLTDAKRFCVNFRADKVMA